MDEDEAGEANTAGETTEVRSWGSDEPIRVDGPTTAPFGLSPEAQAEVSKRLLRWGMDGPMQALPPGHEIDMRPDPAGVHAPLPVGEPPATLWPDGNTTGAFISRAASIRHEVKPYRWWDRISPGMLALWGGFVALPAGAGAWAVFEVWRRVHGG